MSVTWQMVHDEALRRIQARQWPPAAQIPNEADLATEMGCSRATVNRALQALAEAGWLERRRKAGTRVAASPKRKAHLAIPLIRQEIEQRGQEFGHALVARDCDDMPPALRAALELAPQAKVQHVQTLYLADARPFAFEERWVHLDAAPGFADADLDKISPNEWLVQNAPFSHGTLEYSANPATDIHARFLDCDKGEPLMGLERRTYGPKSPVTLVRLTYAPGHRIRLQI